MRPALQRLLESPSALALLRNAIDQVDHANACHGCGAYLKVSRRRQTTVPTAEKQESLAKLPSASILSYVTGDFKKRRKRRLDVSSVTSRNKDIKYNRSTGNKLLPLRKTTDDRANLEPVGSGEEAVPQFHSSDISPKDGAVEDVRLSGEVNSHAEVLDKQFHGRKRQDNQEGQPPVSWGIADLEGYRCNSSTHNQKRCDEARNNWVIGERLQGNVGEEDISQSREDGVASDVHVDDATAKFDDRRMKSFRAQLKGGHKNEEPSTLAAEEEESRLSNLRVRKFDPLTNKTRNTPRPNSLYSPAEAAHGHRQFILCKAGSEPRNDTDYDRVIDGTLFDHVEHCLEPDHIDEFRGFSAETQWKNLLRWDTNAPLIPAIDSEAKQWVIDENCDLESSNALSSFGKQASLINWKAYLISFDRFQYESNVELEPYRGPRLIDYEEHAIDFELWLRLIQFRERHHGVKGSRAIWLKFLRKDLALPTKGSLAYPLWRSLISLGFSDSGILDTVIAYARAMKDRTDEGWQPLYYKIIRYCLENPKVDAYRRHCFLYRRFLPTRTQVMSLFRYGLEQRRPDHRLLHQIYQDLPYRDLYSNVMPYLLSKGDLHGAAIWHKRFVSQNDLPKNPQEYRLLFQQMVRYGDRTELTAMTHQMVQKGIPLPTFIERSSPQEQMTHRRIDQRLAATFGIIPKPIGDDFYARMFATKFFSVETANNLLAMLGADVLGPASLRELVLRLKHDPQTILAQVEQLREKGLSFDESTYCKLVLQLAETGDSTLLENVGTCDLHPDTFEDKILQESLLAEYHSKGDWLQYDRTFAILMIRVPEKYRRSYSWNLRLRLQLKQQDLSAVTRTLDIMQASQIHMSPRSMNYVKASLLSRRTRSWLPWTTRDLPFIINIWQNYLECGGILPALSWREILKRLGMVGKLEEFEKLALWLAEWYSRTPARMYLGARRTSLQIVTRPRTEHEMAVPVRLEPHHPNHPLHVLFPKGLQQGIITWGFRYTRIGGPDWRWGLYLLLKLRKFTVHVERQNVAKACMLRLIQLFRPKLSNRIVNRRERAKNARHLNYYIQEMEKIGGKHLFVNRQWDFKLSGNDEQRWSILRNLIQDVRMERLFEEVPSLYFEKVQELPPIDLDGREN